MALNYEKLAQTALNLIRSNGSALTSRKKAAGTFDPATNEITGQSPASYSVFGIFETINKNLIDGVNIKREDKIILLSVEGLEVAIEEKDVIIESNVNWNIVNVEEVKPANKIIYYKLQVRK
jgi:hypothetical protein